jgi:hypothetical protein
MTYTALLDAAGNNVTLTVGGPHIDAIMRRVDLVSAGSVPRAVAYNEASERTFTCEALITAASKDLLLAAIGKVANSLWNGCTLAITSTSASAARTLNIYPGGQIDIPADSDGDLNNKAIGTITARIEPYALGASAYVNSLNASAITVPTTNMVDLSTIPGDYPMALELYTIAQDTVNWPQHSIYMTVPPAGTTYNTYIWQAESDCGLGPAGANYQLWADGTSAYPSGGTNAVANKVAGASNGFTLSYNCAGLTPGPYLLVAKAGQQNVSYTGTITAFYATFSGLYPQIGNTVSITGAGSNHYQIWELGAVWLPPTVTKGVASYIWFGCSSTGRYADSTGITVDWVGAIPLHNGLVRYHCDSSSGYCQSSDFDPAGQAFMNGTSYYGDEVMPGPVFAPPGARRLLVVAEPPTNAATIGVNLSVQGAARYAVV